jgi:hypothetical protein
MTLDHLARMLQTGFQKTDHRFAQVDGQFDKLAAAAHLEFQAIRRDMATSAEANLLREDLRILRTDVEDGFRSLTPTLKELLAEVQELRAMDAELTELRVRVKRLEKKAGITG